MNRFVYLDLQRLGYDLLTEINKFLGELKLFLHSRFKLKDIDPLSLKQKSIQKKTRNYF